MSNTTDKHDWVNVTLHSLDGAKRAAAPTDLYERAKGRHGRRSLLRLSTTQTWLAAASLALLLTANALTWWRLAQPGGSLPQQPMARAVAAEYFAFNQFPEF